MGYTKKFEVDKEALERLLKPAFEKAREEGTLVLRHKDNKEPVYVLAGDNAKQFKEDFLKVSKAFNKPSHILLTDHTKGESYFKADFVDKIAGKRTLTSEQIVKESIEKITKKITKSKAVSVTYDTDSTNHITDFKVKIGGLNGNGPQLVQELNNKYVSIFSNAAIGLGSGRMQSGATEASFIIVGKPDSMVKVLREKEPDIVALVEGYQPNKSLKFS
jgi:hypothetical protein